MIIHNQNVCKYRFPIPPTSIGCDTFIARTLQCIGKWY